MGLLQSNSKGVLVSILLLGVILPYQVHGKTLIVGGNAGWTNLDTSKSGPPDYTTWHSSQTIAVGDVLVFNYAANSHDVHLFATKLDYDACIFKPATALAPATSSSYSWTAPEAGVYYFGSSFGVDGSHCDAGQKLAVTVVSPTATTPLPSPVAAPIVAPVVAPVASPIVAPIVAPIVSPILAPVNVPVPVPVATPVAAPILAPVPATPVPVASPVPVLPSPAPAPVSLIPAPSSVNVSTPAPAPVGVAPVPTPVAAPGPAVVGRGPTPAPAVIVPPVPGPAPVVTPSAPTPGPITAPVTPAPAPAHHKLHPPPPHHKSPPPPKPHHKAPAPSPKHHRHPAPAPSPFLSPPAPPSPPTQGSDLFPPTTPPDSSPNNGYSISPLRWRCFVVLGLSLVPALSIF